MLFLLLAVLAEFPEYSGIVAHDKSLMSTSENTVVKDVEGHKDGVSSLKQTTIEVSKRTGSVRLNWTSSMDREEQKKRKRDRQKDTQSEWKAGVSEWVRKRRMNREAGT